MPMGIAQESPAQILWFRQIPAYILSHAASLLAGLASVSLLPRILGAEHYGVYALVTVTVTMAASLFGEWLVPSGIRLSSEFPRGLIWNALGWVALSSSLLGGLTVGLLLGNQEMSPQICFWAFVLAVATILSKPLLAYIRASLRPRLIALYALFSSLGSLLLGLSLFLSGRKLSWLVAGLSVTPWVLFLIYSVKSRFFLTIPRLQLIRLIFQFGLPIAITSIGGQILQFADRYMLALYKSHTDVGIYNITYNISDKILSLMFSVLFSSMYPVGSSAWARGYRADAESLLNNAFRSFALFAGAFIWFQAVSGASLVIWLAGDAFRPPSLMPVLVAMGSWLWFTGILQHQPFEWDKRTLWITAMTLFAAALNLVLNWLLIPIWGMIGAATATLASYAAYLSVCTFINSHYGYGRLVWQPWVVLRTSMGALLLWYWFEGSASLWQGTLAALSYAALGFGSLFLNRKGAR